MGYLISLIFLFILYVFLAVFFNVTLISLIAAFLVYVVSSYGIKKYLIPEEESDSDFSNFLNSTIPLAPSSLVAFSAPIWQPSSFCNSHPDVSKAPIFYDEDLKGCLEDIWIYANWEPILVSLIINVVILVFLIRLWNT